VESFIAYWMRWPSLELFVTTYSWAWPLCEILHFAGLILLFGSVAVFDARLIGLGKGLPFSQLSRLLPWGVLGFGLCAISGSVFVGGIYGNVAAHPYDVLKTNGFLQLKLVCIALAGLNLLAFHLTGMARAVDALGPGDDAPPLARFLGGTSLLLWIAVVYFGRLIPWAL
jgi:hypothetical protein